MWIFTFAPTWAIHLVFSLGILGTIAGFVLEFLPFIKKFAFAIKVLSLLILSLGVYLEGGLNDYKEWQLKALKLEARAKEAEVKAAEKNVEIQTRVVTKTNTVYQKGDDIIKYIDREVVKNQEIVK